MPGILAYIIEQSRALLPEREVHHPLGCHRPRTLDCVVFEKLVQVLVFDCARWQANRRQIVLGHVAQAQTGRVDRGRPDGRPGGDGARSL